GDRRADERAGSRARRGRRELQRRRNGGRSVSCRQRRVPSRSGVHRRDTRLREDGSVDRYGCGAEESVGAEDAARRHRGAGGVRPGVESMIVSFLAALLLAASARGGCDRDTLAAVVNDHDRAAAYVLVTTSGRRLRAYGQDFINPNEWRARDPLDICTGDDSLSLRVRNV